MPTYHKPNGKLYGTPCEYDHIILARCRALAEGADPGYRSQGVCQAVDEHLRKLYPRAGHTAYNRLWEIWGALGYGETEYPLGVHTPRGWSGYQGGLRRALAKQVADYLEWLQAQQPADTTTDTTTEGNDAP